MEDADIDLFEEDAYLAGIAENLHRTGSTSVEEIRIDRSIDRRLSSAKAESSGAANAKRSLLAYRSAMLDLAGAMSRAARLPLRDAGS
jgi:hypothetical protein